MKKFLIMFLFLSCGVWATDLILNKSDGDIFYASDANSILNHLDGALFPISASTRNKIDDTNDLGSGTYRWRNAYLSGDLTVDTSTLYVDSANNRVGIGTTSPVSKLDLSLGDNQAINLTSSGANYTSYINFVDSDAANSGRISYDHSSNAMRFATGTGAATERVRIDVNGNIGIGTASPSQKFHIEASGDVRQIIKSTTPTTGVSRLYLIAGNDDTKVGALTARPDGTLDINTYGYSEMTLNAGKVGIGTTAPDKALEINSATGANMRLTYNDSNGSAANYSDFSISSGGDLTISPSGKDTQIIGNLTVTGNISGTLSTPAQPSITSVGTLTSVTSTGKISTTLTSEQLRLSYDGSNYTSAAVSSAGNLVINPSGKNTNLNGNLIVTGNISGYLNNVYYEEFHISYWNMDSTASYYQVVGVNDQLRICGASVVIYKDDGSTVVPLERGGYWEYTESDDRFTIYRDTSGIFDSADYDGTGEWRGRFTVFYTDTAARL